MTEEETPAEVEVTEDGGQEAVTEPTIEDSTAQVAESQGPDWETFWDSVKGAENLKGRSAQEVVDHLSDLHHKYGRQTNELGELRRYKDAYEQLQRQMQGQSQQQKPKGLTEAEEIAFAQQFQNKPYSAFDEYFVPKMTETIQQKVMQNIGQQLGQTIQYQAQNVAIKQEWEGLVRNHPEVITDNQLNDAIQQLMGPDYLNYGVPYEQAYDLAILARDERSLFSDTLYFMQRGIHFKEAKDIASLRRNAAKDAKKKKEQIKEEVAKAQGGLKTTTKSGGTAEPEIQDMDDAFAP